MKLLDLAREVDVTTTNLSILKTNKARAADLSVGIRQRCRRAHGAGRLDTIFWAVLLSAFLFYQTQLRA